MRGPSAFLIPVIFWTAATAGVAQWDAANQAKGWARIDITGVAVFHDLATRTLHSWAQETSISGKSVSAAKLDRVPEKYFFDGRNNAWVASGQQLAYIDRNGKVGPTAKLPGEVGDLVWDSKLIYLSYRSSDTYVEARDIQDGSLTWSYGQRPRPDAPALNQFPRLALDDKRLFVAPQAAFRLIILEAAKGKVMGEQQFSADKPQALAPAADGSMGPLHTWYGESKLLLAATPAQLQLSGVRGLVLIELDLNTTKLKTINTTLPEGALFVGVQERTAFFIKPEGGLAAFEIQ